MLTGADASLLAGVAAVIWFGYSAGWEARAGRTPGKRLCGLAVVTAGDGRPDAAAAALRTLARVVDWLPAGYLLGAFVVAADDGRRLGDRVAGTRVVHVDARDRADAVAPAGDPVP